MRVLATTEVNEYWENLITILYEKGYFGSEKFAQRYVDELVYEIKTNLPYRTSKPAPKRFETYEENEEITYLVCHIENNHTAAQYLNV
jgi:polyhydroxyalkanoate synthesis regulator phasin